MKREQRHEAHGDRVLRCYAGRPRSVDQAFRETVSLAGDRIALVDDGRRLSYRELDALVDKLGRGLCRFGVATGDRVAIMAGNGIEAAAMTLAICRIGAVLVPIGVRLMTPEIAHMLADAGASAFVFEAAFDAQVPTEIDMPCFRIGGAQDKARPFEDLFVDGAKLPSAPVGEDDLFGILYTSGTTGRPKGAMLTHLNVIHSAIHWREQLELGQDETTILTIPWSHVAGLCGVVVPFLTGGGRIVMQRDFKRENFLALAEHERITHALLVPAMYGLLLLGSGLSGFGLTTWRLAVYGSAPMPEATIRRFSEALPQLSMCNAYGATETASPATIMPVGGEGPTDSIGKVVPCGDIVVMDPDGREVAAGADGEFWIGGPMISPGYWRNDAATEAAFVAGYWKSGDIGSIDADGFVRIADRIKDMVNRGGFKVYPAEVENVLTDYPGIVEAAIVGRPDEILGERVVAFVRSVNADIAPLALRAHCLTALADYKVPDFIEVGTDPLPRNANGKIQKDQLRARVHDLVRLPA